MIAFPFTVIPFNAPGLPEPEALSSRFVFKPVSVDTSDPVGPRIALRHATRHHAIPHWPSDGIMCIYPEIETVAHLFNANLRSRHGEATRAMVVTSQSTDGVCTIFGFGYSDGNPQLVVNILPDEHLPTILHRDRESAIDVDHIGQRLEITQTFSANSLGLVSRISNEVTHRPKAGTARRGGEPVFTFYDDPASIADVCSFYLTRALTLVDNRFGEGPLGDRLPGEVDSVLRWSPAPSQSIAAFATVFILTRMSVSVRRARGDTSFAMDYNRRAGWPERGPGAE
ncbi:MAG: hypothetical protein QOJ91_3081 [Sphingomonadales bacterium]|nr:hypothetical protein [Sphingomonadales bacterium]